MKNYKEVKRLEIALRSNEVFGKYFDGTIMAAFRESGAIF